MTDFSALLDQDRNQPARRLAVVDAAGFDAFAERLSPRERTMADAARFEATSGAVLLLPGGDSGDWWAVAAVDDAARLGPWDLAPAAERLPGGRYRLEGAAAGDALHGWLMAQHRPQRHRTQTKPQPERQLLVAAEAPIARAVALAEAEALIRDLVDEPAASLGPAELAAAVVAVAEATGGRARQVVGEALLEERFPLVHAVGAAATGARAPRLVDVRWGDPTLPLLTIVGKGVCFDSGGLNIKPGAGMALMKKDMGGAAHALALARLVRVLKLPVQLRLIIPAVENAIAGAAMRPGDVYRSRQGLTVEIGNTDAEGRLILADALALACEEQPAMLIDLATLTGAARVALGPDLPALFASSDDLALACVAAARAASDPLWPLPLWQPYGEMLKSDVADIGNSADGPFAGAVTAALFLQRFVHAHVPWLHLDLFAWNPVARPGRPKGGAAMGLRALIAMLETHFDPGRDSACD